MGQFELKNGNLFVLAEAAGGVYNGNQLRLICEVADDVSVFLKVTEDQRIGFMLPKDKFEELQGKLSKSGILLKHYRDSSVISPKACLGELCQKCEQDALGDSIEVTASLNEKFKNVFAHISIGMNGCSVACADSATNDIHIVGENKGYKIYIGGQAAGEPKLAEFLIDGISKQKICEIIEIILDVYSKNKQNEESLGSVVTRIGVSEFHKAIELTNNTASQSPSNEEEIQIEEETPLPASEAVVPEAEAVSVAEEEIQIEEETPPPASEAVASEAESVSIAEEEEIQIEEETPPPESEAVATPEAAEAVGVAPETESVTVAEEEEIHIGEDSSTESSAASLQEKNETATDNEESLLKPVDHGSGDEILDSEISIPNESLDFNEDVISANSVRNNNKTSIQVDDSYMTVALPNGSDFRILLKTIKQSKVFEMKIEDEIFIIENIDEKIQIKCGEFEMHIPLLNSSSLEDDEDLGGVA